LTRDVSYESQRPALESAISREFTFLLNNWALLGFLLFVLVATTFPMLSEAISGEKVTVGPPYYNVWIQPLGLTIFALMGIGTLFGWKKTSTAALKRAFIAPGVAMAVAMSLHVAFGKAAGFPAVVWGDAIYGGAMGAVLRAFNAYTPVLGFSLCIFNATVIIQEFVLLFRARKRTGASKEGAWLWPVGFVFSVIAVLGLVLMRKSFPSAPTFAFTVVATSLAALMAPYFLFTLISLPHASRRRYGGYIVHFGLVFVFFGFTGKSWTIDRETTMAPHDHYEVAGYDLEYLGPRMELDVNKRMVFGDVMVARNGTKLGVASPAKFMYKKMPDSPTTEVSMMHSLRDDLYLVVGSIDPQTKVASFQIHINPLVSWIWFGAIILIFGSIVCMWPELQPAESRVWAFARGAAGATASFTLGIIIAAMPAPAWAQQQGTSSLHAGTVHIENEREHALFNSLRCMCGTCARDLLSTCSCTDAEEAREALRRKVAQGETNDQIILEYAQQYGAEALAIPPNQGGMRAIYAVPLVAIGAGGAGIVVLIRRWRGKPTSKKKKTDDDDKGGGGEAKRDALDERLDEELRDLDG
ncbi:MAG TPA: cytochrome c-type biogenesis CcmF C-terminal domain-containing protein, partial [Polyangiaceae bacterium]|nr:cytochrome c-type biogenesis CcmF C-terminal domain-containing protein [Polyangiaceae bacterium]